MIDPIGPILGRLPSGVFILTARDGTAETGMLSSWVMQAGFKPPMLTAAVQQGRYLGDWLTSGRSFVLNQLAAGQKSLLQRLRHTLHDAPSVRFGLAAIPAIAQIYVGVAQNGMPQPRRCRAASRISSGNMEESIW